VRRTGSVALEADIILAKSTSPRYVFEDGQTGSPTRPQVSHNRRRNIPHPPTPELPRQLDSRVGYLRIPSSRERRWKAFSHPKQACQNGHSTRPQVRKDHRRTLWGTSRTVSNRERRWGSFSQACYRRRAITARHTSKLLIAWARIPGQRLPVFS